VKLKHNEFKKYRIVVNLKNLKTSMNKICPWLRRVFVSFQIVHRKSCDAFVAPEYYKKVTWAVIKVTLFSLHHSNASLKYIYNMSTV